MADDMREACAKKLHNAIAANLFEGVKPWEKTDEIWKESLRLAVDDVLAEMWSQVSTEIDELKK